MFSAAIKKKKCLLVLFFFTICALSLTILRKIPPKTTIEIIEIKTASREKNVLKEMTKCLDKNRTFSFYNRGDFTILNNFIKASRYFRCEESITLTTQGDFRFLDNLVPLLEVWRGPVSLAIYAPGDDFFSTLESIAFLRNCLSSRNLVRELVSFHIFFEAEHTPKNFMDVNFTLLGSYADDVDCSVAPPFTLGMNSTTYRASEKLFYPINVARNIARENAETHFIFPSDIELIPTPNFIEKFFEMIKRSPEYVAKRKVFVLPIFEVEANESIPKTKTALQKMLLHKKAIVFHESLCWRCHRVTKMKTWKKAPETEGLGVFAVGKRQKSHTYWEPFYVGTNDDPFFDERLTWEGQYNKIVQAFTMCLLDYDFLVLDNAFLVHKPGIKKRKIQLDKFRGAMDAAGMLIRFVQDELATLIGDNPECDIEAEYWQKFVRVYD